MRRKPPYQTVAGFVLAQLLHALQGAETVEDGLTGFLCHTPGEFIAPAYDVQRLYCEFIRQRAIAKYSTPSVAGQYQPTSIGWRNCGMAGGEKSPLGGGP